ncbi:hypothetical protein KVJ63_04810 [Helicobacter pylori]|uniref:hypothetical protein n=1 Tax=Helicobacter pylori TaxID=210 RepID=UPI00165AA8AD|nr:hypothetical protein [Helicobacter pylori]MBM0606259.1 hypothetical protein [Helicobacter pylori]MBM0613647.1 hypothetical protein [Helicobacter pylori]QQW75125.1 hypothetical protein HG578_04690 [Helicobacter pylori]WQZ68449.1 hypothetical protein KVJ63_04810 [Helicobacter pylori]
MIDKARKNLKDLKSIFLYWYEMFGSNDKSKDMMKAFMKDLAFAKNKNEVIKAQDNELVKEFMQELNSLSFKEQLEFYQTNRDYDPSLDNDENSSELLDAFIGSLELVPLDKKEASKEAELKSKEKEPKETLGFNHSLGVSVLKSRIEEAKNHFNEKEKGSNKRFSDKEFKKFLKDRAKNSMTNEEMQVLLLMINNKKSNLMPSHKEFLQECLIEAVLHNKNINKTTEYAIRNNIAHLPINKAESFLVRTYNHSLGILNENIAEKLKIPKKEKEILQPLNANEEQALNTALENNEIDARTFKSWEFGSKENASMSEELTQNNSKLSHFNENSTTQNNVGQNNVKEPNNKTNNSKQNHSLSNSDLTSNTDYNKLVADMFENQMDANGNYVGKKFSAQAYDNKTPCKVATGNASERSTYLYSKKTKSKNVGMER